MNQRNGLGNGEFGQFTFLDIVSLMSFFLSVMNLNENLSQNDKQELAENLSNKADLLLKEIHGHLQDQDEKIDKILEVITK